MLQSNKTASNTGIPKLIKDNVIFADFFLPVSVSGLDSLLSHRK